MTAAAVRIDTLRHHTEKIHADHFVLPPNGFVRLKVIVGDRRTGTLGVLPVGTTTWWNGVKSGRFPKPVKLGPRITAWRVEDIRDLLERLGR